MNKWVMNAKNNVRVVRAAILPSRGYCYAARYHAKAKC